MQRAISISNPLKDMAQEIAQDTVAFARALPTTDSVRFVHHSGKAKVPIHEFRVHMERVHCQKFAEVDIEEWIARALEAGIDPLITTYLEGIIDRGTLFSFLT